MPEYIEREVVLQALKDNHDEMKQDEVYYGKKRLWYEALDYARTLNVLDKVPAADVAEVRHGEWEECDWVEFDGHSECVHYPKQALCCSECRHAFKKELLYADNYCPNCGAKMDGERK